MKASSRDSKTARLQNEIIHTTTPQLATLREKIPTDGRFLHEIKYDGYRTWVVIMGSQVLFQTRNGHEWTFRYQGLVDEFLKLGAKSAILDGEMVALDEKGRSHFSSLQNALKNQEWELMHFYAFDLLEWDGRDCRSKTLRERKQLLHQLLAGNKSAQIHESSHVESTKGTLLFRKAQREGLEGIVSKDGSLPYLPGRGDGWQKIKTSLRQELVIGGYTKPQGSRVGLGSLLLGEFRNSKLDYVGRVGTGFNTKSLHELTAILQDLQTGNCPFHPGPNLDSAIQERPIQWVRPQLVAEIEFKAWTDSGLIRQGSFQGLRWDKAPSQVRAESLPASRKKKDKSISTSLKLTHPQKILYPSSQTRKIDVANYYQSVGPWLLPHLRGRPLSLVRCPDNVESGCFFQKHPSPAPGLKFAKVLGRDVFFVDSIEGILRLVQGGAIELHPWQCQVQTPECPDQIIFDFDPDESLAWEQVVQASLEVRDLLRDWGLESFVKTTGGKGLHVHAPLEPVHSWKEVKNFAWTLCHQLELKNPDLYTTRLLKRNRQGKIFLDYLRNGLGATAVAPYSLRSRARPAVAIPVSWKELETLESSDHWEWYSTLERLASQKRDPWRQMESSRRRIAVLELKKKSPSPMRKRA